MLVVASVLIGAPAASAVVAPAVTFDGPSADILEVADAALAEDGTGGVVYRKRVEGRSHIFVARFLRGRFEGPLRVDTGQRFDSTWPRIAAGVGGRLLVVWVQELGLGTDRLYSATLSPGGASFQPPVPVDLNVGESLATDPDLAMNRAGSAVVAYRVITDTEPAGAPAGWVGAQFRLARWRGATWVRRGAVNRSTSSPVPPPDAGNGAKVALDPTGNGVVAWQEPDDEQVPRIWARRIFGGTTVGIPLAASPLQLDGKPVGSAADRLSVSTAGLGLAAVSFRQGADPATGLTAPAVMVNALPDSTSTKAGQFTGPKVVDGTVANAGATTSISVNADGQYRLAFGDDRAVKGVRGDLSRDTFTPSTLDSASGIDRADPSTTIGPEGEAAWAWPSLTNAGAGVVVRESPLRGETDDAFVAARLAGPVADVRLGGSGLGDALVAFRQGDPITGQVAASWVDAAPSDFGISTPADWVRPTQARIAWERAPDALGGVTYAVALDGQVRARGLRGSAYRPPVDQLDSGIYAVRVLATDRVGQERLSGSVNMKVDAEPPTAQIRRSGRRVRVRVTDRQPGGSSGVEQARVRFGDGRSSTARTVTHRYKRGGTYRLTITVRDRAGNRATLRRTVSVG